MSLDSPVRYVKGVGPEVEKKLFRLGIKNIAELLEYFPSHYEDRTRVTPLDEIKNGEDVLIKGVVISPGAVIDAGWGLSAFKAAVSDGKDTAWVVAWRRFNPYHRHDVFASLRQVFEKDKEVIVWGRARIKNGIKEMDIKDYGILSGDSAGDSQVETGGIVPVYPLMEGLTQKKFRKIMKNAVKDFSYLVRDFTTSTRVIEKKSPQLLSAGVCDIMPRRAAIEMIHFPTDFETLEKARRSLAFGEYLIFQTTLALARRITVVKNNRPPCRIKRTLLTGFKSNLGFEFTRSQKKAINEIFKDMTSKDTPMHRILVGDVGSGKTAVALSAMLLGAENSRQAIMIAPTEILARQHYETITRLTSNLGIKTVLLTAALSSGGKKKVRDEILSDIKSGAANIIVGTHALLEDRVVTGSREAVIVIDEQHKFGVEQRLVLRRKAPASDVLLMSATPIPRSLAMVVYGDMDVSVLDEMPPGRKPVKTMMMEESAAYDFAKKEISCGNQVFIVFPLVGESDEDGFANLKSARAEAERLAREVFTETEVGLIHGKMKAADKEDVMKRFKSGGIKVLIATTVIEVGIDVPQATVLIVEHAERYGLATLHQLRGRVGRSDRQSYCLLVPSPEISDEARRRLKVLIDTSDGFEVARADMRMRGTGRIIGTEQHGRGEMDLRIVRLESDKDLIEKAASIARAIASSSPDFIPVAIKSEIEKRYADRIIFPQVG